MDSGRHQEHPHLKPGPPAREAGGMGWGQVLQGPDDLQGPGDSAERPSKWEQGRHTGRGRVMVEAEGGVT